MIKFKLTDQQKIQLAVGVVVAALASLTINLASQPRSSVPPDNLLITADQPTSTEATSPSAVKSTVKKPSAIEQGVAYEQALELYAGYRLQFNAACQASPSRLTIKNGTKLMFDNRADQTRTIVIDGKNYSFKPWEFKVLAISTKKTLPYTVTIDCGAARNVAQLLLQK